MDPIIPIHSFSRYMDLYPGKLSRFSRSAKRTPGPLSASDGQACAARQPTGRARSRPRSAPARRSVFPFLEDPTGGIPDPEHHRRTERVRVAQAVTVQTEVESLGDIDAKSAALERLMDAVTKWLDTIDRLNEDFEYQSARVDEVVARCSALAAVPATGMALAATANRHLVRLWATAVRVRDAQASASRPLLGFMVPRAGMSIVDVAFSLYQSPANVVDLLPSQ